MKAGGPRLSPRVKRSAVIILDALILIVIGVILVILETGGGTVRVAGVRISTHAVWRPLTWVGVLVAVRILLSRRIGLFGWRRAEIAARFRLQDPLHTAVHPLPTGREILFVTVGLTVAIGTVLYQQIRDLYGIPDLGDPLFSMWRLAWVAHQVVSDPRHLFDANIFYPQPGTLTYSDAMLLPALAVAPFLWAGVPLALVYQGLFLSAMLFSGLATYALARVLGLPAGAAWVGALIFALCQYRIEHYSHLELQMAQWMPLTLLAAHRLLATGRTRFILYLGLAVAAQWYSSMYYGLFLTIYVGVFICVFAAAWRAGWRRFLYGVAALVLGVGLVLPLARVYRSTDAARGSRSEEVVTFYSARGSDWLQPNTGNRWYRDVHIVKREAERQLFPNVIPVVFAAAGATPPLTAARLAILVSGLVAFDGSLGFNGHWYPWAYAYLTPLKSMRVPARFAILVNLSLALLAGAGVARLLRRLASPVPRRVAVSLVSGLFLVESLPDLRLTPVWREPPSLYASLGPRSGAVLFEYPVHPHSYYFGQNLPYMYFSTWHWTRMVNGYSGFVPGSYDALAAASDGFPEGASVPYLQKAGVTHVSINCALWAERACANTIDKLTEDRRFRILVSTQWQGKPAQLYEIVR